MGLTSNALFAIAGAALIAAPAAGQATPYKLLVLWGGDGIAVIDYPSAARCKAGEAVMGKRTEQELQQRKPKATADGRGVIFAPPWQMATVCIPG